MKRRRELADLEPCPKCGRLGGERKQSVNITGKYYVRCRCCGYTTSSNGEPTENAKTLAAFLRYGAEQAQTRGELCRLTGWTDRVVRQAVEDARKAAGDDGPFIVTAVGGRGYYLTDDPDEIERHYHGEYARAMSILVSTKGERRYLKKRGRL